MNLPSTLLLLLSGSALFFSANGAPHPVLNTSSDQQYYNEYKGHQVLRLSLRHDEEWRLIMDHVSELQPNHTIDIWKVTKSGIMDIMVAPQDQPVVQRVLGQRKVPATVLLHDVSREIKREKRATEMSRMSWNLYHRTRTIHDWMDNIAARHNKIASVKTIGLTYEGRPLKVLKINSGRSKKKIFVDGGIHAREWIAPAAATYVIKEFLDNYAKHKNLVDSFEWHFLPLLNADGYEYSHTDKRLWRKTRSKRRAGGCPGVDANRNFPIHWKEGEEASATPCAENYPGEQPSSENCVRALQNYILQLNADRNLVAYFSLHSYGQLWLLPTSFDKAKPKDYKDLMEAGQAGVQAINSRSGNVYTVGDPFALLNYHSTGTSSDWVRYKAGVAYCFVLELSPPIRSFYDRINGANFGLDSKRIPEVGEDVIVGLRASLNVIKRKLRIH